MSNFKKSKYDPVRSVSNLARHGIDFKEAQHLWEGVFVENSLPYAMERRFMVTGPINNKFWSAIITYRHEVIRIISVRRARQKETARWHNHHP
ncbi:BrnT family toxin [Puniceicoccales bacterium CK1056]|uniref:BrnT family toxin n=1 Tax=Oceanipulchritudo coccoides TaxID=2706888 RepID=A0A6B2M0A4_9BACT|nr:BrnT family toxin [Oceanipulchritudo coccoides]NDV61457.1 BrnT family toxin [Oceanipulchritudo coccoides]